MGNDLTAWLSGFARLIDLFGVFDAYNESRTPQEADARALWTDWFVVGNDLYAAYQDDRTAQGRQGERSRA